VKRKRRLEIVVETKRRFTLRKSGPPHMVRCKHCSGPLVSAEEAVAITGLSSRTIHRLVETAEIHFMETPAGALLICPNSSRDSAGEAEGESLHSCSLRNEDSRND
jgi:hypothetical protein